MRFKALIFDCDGTLVDSERVGNQVIVESVRDFGLDLSLEEALEAFTGRKMTDTLGIIQARLGHPLPKDYLHTLRAQMAEAFKTRLNAMEGVHELLRTLQVPICVASNGPHEKMEVSLGVTGLIDYFEYRIFSAYECDSWKPEPGLFLFAAERLGIDPIDCAVIEDSPLGVEAALRAGMTAFGYAPRGDGSALRLGTTTVFHHMDDLASLLC